MSITERIAFGAAANWFSRGVTILLGLVLIPVLFRNLPKEELGVWLLLGQSWAALGIFDLGFGVTLTRRIAFAKAKSGSDPTARLSEETLSQIADLVATGQRLYRALAVVAFLFSSGAGWLYLRTLDLADVSPINVLLAWGILCLSQAIAVWATVWTCLLQGVGYVGWDAILASFINAMTLVAQIAVALAGCGLAVLATVAACGALSQRVLILSFARARRPELFTIRGSWQPALVKAMLPFAFHAWLTAMGLTVVLNSDQLFVGKLIGAEKFPAYRAAYLILLNLNMLAVTVASASGVFVSHLWQAGEIDEVHRIVIRNLRLGLGLMAGGGACVLALGPKLFTLWLGPGHFIGYPILTMFFLLLVFEAQCFIIGTSSRATEDEAFAAWAIAAGCLKIVLSALLGLRYGLAGIAAATLLAQLATNHWFMVYRGLRRLRMSLRRHVLDVVVPTTIFFVLTFCSVCWTLQVMTEAVLWAQVSVACGVAACPLTLLLSKLMFDRSQGHGHLLSL